MINFVAIHRDALTTASSAPTWSEAIAEVLRWANDPSYNRPEAPIELVYFSEGDRLEHFTVEALRRVSGRVGGREAC